MELTTKNFKKEVIESDIPVFIDFWASWCPPCKMIEPAIKKLEIEYQGKVKIGKINVDRNPSIASKYHIDGVPTYIIFKNGKIIKREVAAKSLDELRKFIESIKIT
ncbi:MAG: thioredoxin [Candidatus Helarchaeota archaeon]|nr:thioredoxin [Candidatus Helarchaeota archaeon]